jgi:hypothetical protein
MMRGVFSAIIVEVATLAGGEKKQKHKIAN